MIWVLKSSKKRGKISGKLRLPVTEALHIKGECGTLVILRRAEVIDGSKPPGTQARQRLFILILSRVADAFHKINCTFISLFVHSKSFA